MGAIEELPVVASVVVVLHSRLLLTFVVGELELILLCHRVLIHHPS